MSREPYSALTKRLINEGLRPPVRPTLTDAQVMIERLEGAAQSGTSAAHRRRVLLEAAQFIRERHGVRTERAA